MISSSNPMRILSCKSSRDIGRLQVVRCDLWNHQLPLTFLGVQTSYCLIFSDLIYTLLKSSSQGESNLNPFFSPLIYIINQPCLLFSSLVLDALQPTKIRVETRNLLSTFVLVVRSPTPLYLCSAQVVISIVQFKVQHRRL